MMHESGVLMILSGCAKLKDFTTKNPDFVFFVSKENLNNRG